MLQKFEKNWLMDLSGFFGENFPDLSGIMSGFLAGPNSDPCNQLM